MQYLLYFWELKIVINTNTQQGHFGRSCQLKWRVTESGHAKRASNQNILVIRDMKNIETCLATTMNRHIITIHRHIITFHRHIITFHWHIITFHRPVITNHRHVIKNYVVCALYGEGLIINNYATTMRVILHLSHEETNIHRGNAEVYISLRVW